MDGLTVGRMVHYVEGLTDGDIHLAAIVTKVWNDEGKVNLAAFGDMSDVVDEITYSHEADELTEYLAVRPVTEVPYDENKGLSTWHWIERA